MNTVSSVSTQKNIYIYIYIWTPPSLPISESVATHFRCRFLNRSATWKNMLRFGLKGKLTSPLHQTLQNLATSGLSSLQSGLAPTVSQGP